MTSGICDSLIGRNYFFVPFFPKKICRNYYYSVTLKLYAAPAYCVLSASI